MDRPFCGHRSCYLIFEFAGCNYLVDSNHFPHLRKCGHRTGPYHVVNCYFISNDYFFAAVKINDPGEARYIQSEEIKEAAILPERIMIVCVIHRAFIIPRE